MEVCLKDMQLPFIIPLVFLNFTFGSNQAITKLYVWTPLFQFIIQLFLLRCQAISLTLSCSVHFPVPYVDQEKKFISKLRNRKRITGLVFLLNAMHLQYIMLPALWWLPNMRPPLILYTFFCDNINSDFTRFCLKTKSLNYQIELYDSTIFVSESQVSVISFGLINLILSYFCIICIHAKSLKICGEQGSV